MIDIVSLNRVESAHLLVVASEDEDDLLFKLTAAALASSHIQLNILIDVPLVFLDIVILATLELDFLDVLIATESVDPSASVSANC